MDNNKDILEMHVIYSQQKGFWSSTDGWVNNPYSADHIPSDAVLQLGFKKTKNIQRLSLSDCEILSWQEIKKRCIEVFGLNAVRRAKDISTCEKTQYWLAKQISENTDYQILFDAQLCGGVLTPKAKTHNYEKAPTIRREKTPYEKRWQKKK